MVGGGNFSSTEKIKLDTETWGSRELFEVIASRYFQLGNEGGQPTSWEVGAEGGEDVSQRLIKLNLHLQTMGMVGTLEDSNPPVLSISRLPPIKQVMGRIQQVFLWIFMSSFLTIVGLHWTSAYGHGRVFLGLGEFGQSVIFFTMPVILTLLFASFARLSMARRFDVEIGHISPIVLPIPTWWAFGIVGVIGQKRPDLVPVPNRRALGSIELVVPLVMTVSGSLLTIIGLIITPSEPPELERAPFVFDSSLLSGALLNSWMGDDFAIRLQWLNPIGIAGIGLSIVGWAMLLPIPGLPGDRIMQAVIGPSDARDGSTQTSIFLAVLLVMVIVFATAQWTPWIFLAFVAAWQRFNPENVPQPIVLDEYAGLDERVRSRFVALSAFILLAGLPSAIPSYELENYDSGISTSSWPGEIQLEAGSEEEITLEIVPEGVLPVSGWIQVRVEGANPESWSVTSECMDEAVSCRFSEVTEKQKGEVKITIKTPDVFFLPHNLRVIVEVSGFEEQHIVEMSNSTHFGPTSPYWEISEGGEKPIICTEMMFDEGDGFLNVDDPYWKIINGSNVSSGVQEVCLEGHEGAIQHSTYTDGQGRIFGPEISLQRNNSSMGPWKFPIEGSGAVIQVGDDEWEIPDGFVGIGDVLFHGYSGSPFCPSSKMAAEIDTGENWSTVLDNFSAIRISGNNSGEGRVLLGDSGWLSICHNDGTMEPYRLVQSTDVFVHPGGLGVGIQESEFTIYNRDSATFELSVETYSDTTTSMQWEISGKDGGGAPKWIESNGSATILVSILGDLSLERSVWITADPSGIIIHLSARCPLGGC